MKKDKKESGMLVVEATLVFPIMFLIVFIMIVLGNAYFQKSKVEGIIAEMTFYGAAQCADPLTKLVQESKKIPDYKDADYEIEPYRYIFGNMDDIEKDVKEQICKKIKDMNTGLFKGMEPRTTDSSIKTKFNNAYVYSTFSVEADYEIRLPVRLLGMKDYFVVKNSCYYDVPVSDTPEFVRNINMVEDWIQSTKTGNEAIEKANEVMGKVAEYIN